MSLSVLGVGLPRTGTVSLVKALNILGLRAIHYHPERLVEAAFRRTWQVYDDVDAAADFPAALAYREILGVYPTVRCILTVREPREEWLASIHGFGAKLDAQAATEDAGWALLKVAEARAWWLTGPPTSNEDLVARYEAWVKQVKADVPADRLLIYDVCKGDGWGPLCEFLGMPVPSDPFPWENKR